MREPTTALRRLFALALVVAVSGAFAFAQDAQPTWELVVCAAKDDLPYSNQEGQGFENKIMSVMAADLHADLSYIWLPGIQVPRENRRLLSEGKCDVLLDVGDAADGFLTTLAYSQTTYYFVYRDDAPFEVASFDDDVLAGLRIGVVIASPPDEALGERGLATTAVHYSPTPVSPEAKMLDDVAAGALDLAIVYGPSAWTLAKSHPGLQLVPVAPEVDLAGLSMVYQTTMGLRRDDTDLRDLLNRALANSWDDVEAVLGQADVPLLPLPRPVLSVGGAEAEAVEGEARIGVIVPTTGDATLGTLAGEPLLGAAANRGALMAAGELLGAPGPDGRPFRVLISSAPDAASMTRAAERMVREEGVYALVGGFATDEAQALGELAAREDVLFLNVGAQSDSLRGERCDAHAFHLAPSASMYVDGMLAVGAAAGARRWFVVASDGEAQRPILAAVAGRLGDRQGTDSVTTSVVRSGENVYESVFQAIAEARPDLVVLLLTPDEQLTFLGQYEGSGLTVPTLGYPAPAAQTRQFYGAYAQNVRGALAPEQLAAWDATLTTGAAAEFNLPYLSRNGLAADPAAWAAYMGVKLLADAAVRAGSTAATALIDYLEGAHTVVDVGKGPATSFRPWDHQLRQPLYVMRVNREYQDKASMRDLAVLVRELPEGEGSADAQRLDLLGTGAAESGCRLATE